MVGERRASRIVVKASTPRLDMFLAVESAIDIREDAGSWFDTDSGEDRAGAIPEEAPC
jgi:hypothetical protein